MSESNDSWMMTFREVAALLSKQGFIGCSLSAVKAPKGEEPIEILSAAVLPLPNMEDDKAQFSALLMSLANDMKSAHASVVDEEMGKLLAHHARAVEARTAAAPAVVEAPAPTKKPAKAVRAAPAKKKKPSNSKAVPKKKKRA